MRPYARVGLLVVSAILTGCATAIDESETAARTAAALKASFRPAGQAGFDRLEQDETQRACSLAAGKAPPKDVAAMIEQTNLATIRYPADGKLLGDWKNGERIAQEGRVRCRGVAVVRAGDGGVGERQPDEIDQRIDQIDHKQ